MSDDALLRQVQALERDNARLRRLLEQRGSTAGLRHQARNTLAMVREIVRRSAECHDSVESYAAHLEARLDAVFRIQVAIANSPFDGVDLGMLLTDELLTYAIHEGEQLSVDGPDLLLLPAAAGMVGLAIHELATNAVKFGALSAPEGRLAIGWTVADEERGRSTLTLNWVESGADSVSPPPRRGFGSEVIETAISHQLGGTGRLDFAPGGLRCTIRLPLQPTLGSLR